MSSPETVDAEVVETGQEVVPVERHAATLWHTDNPATVLQKATETANALAPVLRDKGMLSKIGDKDYVRVEGWTTLGSMLGVTPVCVWTKRIDGGWEAKVDARTLDGRTIGSAEAMCLRTEDNWTDSDEFAIRSMAQTRAASKALASVLRFVVTLAGFAGTPAEEMQGGGRKMSGPATDGQKEYVLGKGGRKGLLQKADFSQPELAAIRKWAEKDGKLQKTEASTIIDCLGAKGKGTREELLKAAGFVPESDLPPPDESGLESEEGDAFAYEGDREDG